MPRPIPAITRILDELGANIRMARLRRHLSTVQVAERAGIARQTLYHVERGDPAVSLLNYALVLHVLGLEKDIAKVAADDVLGRKLQDQALDTPKRAPRRTTPSPRAERAR
jgi:transcriptional regulator with XRE-family HTH domain